MEVCPLKAVSISEDGGLPVFNRDKCEACVDHPCIEACSRTAIELKGKYMSP